MRLAKSSERAFCTSRGAYSQLRAEADRVRGRRSVYEAGSCMACLPVDKAAQGPCLAAAAPGPLPWQCPAPPSPLRAPAPHLMRLVSSGKKSLRCVLKAAGLKDSMALSVATTSGASAAFSSW